MIPESSLVSFTTFELRAFAVETLSARFLISPLFWARLDSTRPTDAVTFSNRVLPHRMPRAIGFAREVATDKYRRKNVLAMGGRSISLWFFEAIPRRSEGLAL